MEAYKLNFIYYKTDQEIIDFVNKSGYSKVSNNARVIRAPYGTYSYSIAENYDSNTIAVHTTTILLEKVIGAANGTIVHYLGVDSEKDIIVYACTEEIKSKYIWNDALPSTQ